MEEADDNRLALFVPGQSPPLQARGRGTTEGSNFRYNNNMCTCADTPYHLHSGSGLSLYTAIDTEHRD